MVCIDFIFVMGCWMKSMVLGSMFSGLSSATFLPIHYGQNFFGNGKKSWRNELKLRLVHPDLVHRHRTLLQKTTHGSLRSRVNDWSCSLFRNSRQTVFDYTLFSDCILLVIYVYTSSAVNTHRFFSQSFCWCLLFNTTSISMNSDRLGCKQFWAVHTINFPTPLEPDWMFLSTPIFQVSSQRAPGSIRYSQAFRIGHG